MKQSLRLLCAGLAFLGVTATAAHAADPVPAPQDTLLVTQPTLMQATAAMQALGVFMTIENKGTEADALIGAKADGFTAVELHETVTEADRASMRPVSRIEIPAGGQTSLSPAGAHVMLVGNNTARAAGTTLPLTLVFEKAGEKTVQVEVVTPEEVTTRFPAAHEEHGAMPHGGHHGAHH